MRTRLPIVLLAALLSTTCSRSVLPGLVTIHAVRTFRPPGYAYLAPASAPAGPTLFRLMNDDTGPHELRLFRFRPGISDDSARVLLQTGRVGPSLVDPAGAVLIAPAHATSPQQLLVDLKPGEIYGMMCQLSDSTGAPTHDRLGEFAVLPIGPSR